MEGPDFMKFVGLTDEEIKSTDSDYNEKKGGRQYRKKIGNR